MEDFEILKTKFKALEYTVNYKNSDYAPEFFKNSLKTSEENFYKININCLFEVKEDLIFNINKLKEYLKNVTLTKNDLEYDLFLESSSDIEIGEESIILVTFSCKGKIFKKRVKKKLRNNDKLIIDSVRDIKLNFSINPAITTNVLKNVVLNNMKFSFNTKNGFEINSEKGNIKNIESWDFYEFPKTKNKEFQLKLSGIDEVVVNYREEL